MAPYTATDAVTIERSYFETLLRRADVHADDFTKLAGSEPAPAATLISSSDYEALVSVARQYANLQRNLISGGVSEDTIALLSRETELHEMTAQDGSYQVSRNHGSGGGRAGPPVSARPSYSKFSSCNQASSSYHGYGFGTGQGHSNSGGFVSRSFSTNGQQQGWADVDVPDDSTSSPYSPDGFVPEPAPSVQPVFRQQHQEVRRARYARVCNRTVLLCGLPDGAKHEDIVNIIRGGLVLDIYVRAHEHVANVSFLREEDAVRFYEHARRYDLHIANKRLYIKWAERHFHLAGHVAGKIAQGATRNLVIRRCDPDQTETTIRDDLEHIHNLVVIKVEFVGNSCYIKTNSVHNAMFAKTCMMSRAKYKGRKIDWDLDECAQPLKVQAQPFKVQAQPVVPKPKPPKPPKPPPSSKKVSARTQNRFATLRMDEDDNGESDDMFDTSSELPASTTTVGVTV